MRTFTESEKRFIRKRVALYDKAGQLLDRVDSDSQAIVDYYGTGVEKRTSAQNLQYAIETAHRQMANIDAHLQRIHDGLTVREWKEGKYE